MGNYTIANQYSSAVITCEYPDKIKAYEVAIHTSLEAEDTIYAQQLCEDFLALWPNNMMINKVYTTLLENGDAKKLFGGNANKSNTEIDAIDTLTTDPKLAQLLLFQNTTRQTNDSLMLVAEQLKNDVTVGNDVYFGSILKKIGFFFFHAEHDYETSLLFYNESQKDLPNLCETYYYQQINSFMLQDFKTANSFSDSIISCGYPTMQKAYKVAIHTSIEAAEWGKAKHYCKEYLVLWPNDSFIQKVNQAILSNKEWEEIKQLFRRK